MSNNRTPALSRQARAALETLGRLLQAARKERGMTQEDLATRLGQSRYTVMAIERGDPRVAIGTVFEAAAIVGVPLLAESPEALARLGTAAAALANLLPARTAGRRKRGPNDDF